MKGWVRLLQVRVGACIDKLSMILSNLAGRTPGGRTCDFRSMSQIWYSVATRRVWYSCSLEKNTAIGPLTCFSWRKCDGMTKGPTSVSGCPNCLYESSTAEEIISHDIAALFSKSSSWALKSLKFVASISSWIVLELRVDWVLLLDPAVGAGGVGAVSMPWTIFQVLSTFRNLVRVEDQSG